MKSVKATQLELMKKHQEAKSKVNSVAGTGGGISMWPAMDDMRLSLKEVIELIVRSLILIVLSVTVFVYLHGSYIRKLQYYSNELSCFTMSHIINYTTTQVKIDQSVIAFHSDLYHLKEKLTMELNVIWSQVSTVDCVFFLLYVVCVVTLLYYLVDNMLAKSRLTPHRIKTWACLLFVTSTWTGLELFLLITAYSVEVNAKEIVYELLDAMAILVSSSYDTTTLDRVLNYWMAILLPPTGRGLLSVMGLIALQDVMYYLQYYSLPILTALLTPIIQLVLSVKRVYTT